MDDKLRDKLLTVLVAHHRDATIPLNDKHALDLIMHYVKADRHHHIALADAKHNEIYKWLLGEAGDFPGKYIGGKYIWRKELRERIAEIEKSMESKEVKDE